MTRVVIKCAFFFFFFTSCSKPKNISWYDLSKVKFENTETSSIENPIPSPIFSESVKALDGQTVKITGYFLHIYPSKNKYMLSKGPMAACYFCGVGGPETTLELQFNERQKIITDDMVTVTGKLELNTRNDGDFIYKLKDCKAKILD